MIVSILVGIVCFVVGFVLGLRHLAQGLCHIDDGLKELRKRKCERGFLTEEERAQQRVMLRGKGLEDEEIDILTREEGDDRE